MPPAHNIQNRHEWTQIPTVVFGNYLRYQLPFLTLRKRAPSWARMVGVCPQTVG